ncbi:MAG: phosphoribosylanthranilate isomerase [Dysgonamonadaceae bacterium]|jgi:phosphoribosylanthranilate isomerase|nr:phosphoribosylanthranilate isomerase [Dysgonamonadaceae bacterium]MDD3900191.1 phosphoribosylanthranilate isomerase [Dysgonamonadaceae bacterium]MDD4398879.1 phosphoribosylanthranilate isomerase [Dysgonamonadaceae bacterium]MEA5081004.1 phosphoribosylanthranilate isomerase [Dysgonamonadaceae bacterium]
MIIKVCGMRDSDNIRAVEELGVDWMGFIFYNKSSRFVSEVPEYLPLKSKRVGVFVNEALETILQTSSMFGLDLVQLHGNESPEFCETLRTYGLIIIKAFSITDNKEFESEKFKPYESFCDYFLFDTKTELFGGSGKKFNWEILSDYFGNTPFLLSGGISPDDVEEIKSFVHPKYAGIDLNSRFEITPAYKNIKLLQNFIKEIRQ